MTRQAGREAFLEEVMLKDSLLFLYRLVSLPTSSVDPRLPDYEDCVCLYIAVSFAAFSGPTTTIPNHVPWCPGCHMNLIGCCEVLGAREAGIVMTPFLVNLCELT